MPPSNEPSCPEFDWTELGQIIMYASKHLAIFGPTKNKLILQQLLDTKQNRLNGLLTFEKDVLKYGDKETFVLRLLRDEARIYQ